MHDDDLEWNVEDDLVAEKEGWKLYWPKTSARIFIHPISTIEADDRRARAFVQEHAEKGCETCQKALRIIVLRAMQNARR